MTKAEQNTNTGKRLVKVAGVALLLLYPLLIFFGLQFVAPRWIALAMIALIGLRLLGKQMPIHMRIAMAIALLLAAGPSLFSNQEFSLLLYPVLMNAVLFILFIGSYFYPPSIIESLARLQEPDLPESGVRYTRKVTLVWSLFFIINGCIAAYTIGLGKEAWALYNGLISYLFIGLLGAGEWLVRRKVKAANAQKEQQSEGGHIV